MVFRFLNYRKTYLAVLLAFFMCSFLPASQAACTSCLVTVAEGTSGTQVDKTVDDIKSHLSEVWQHIQDEFTGLREFTIDDLWSGNVLPSLMGMTTQLTSVAAQQTLVIGTFFDAKHQLETQRTFQELTARAHKDYHPSVGMCEFGSGIKSLASSERKGEYNAIFLSQRSMDRQLGNANSSALFGDSLDKKNRLAQFKTTYCDSHDNNNGLSLLCAHDGGIGGLDTQRLNKDIDYARTLDAPWTLQVDFTDESQEPSPDEEDVLALASNLYAHHIFPRPGASLLQTPENGNITTLQKRYMDMRAHIAKRNVAQNSFNAITSMKSEGSGESKEFLAALLKELGIEDTGEGQSELSETLGDNPSYHAQMEVLAKKIYQNPDFYTNLYDKPANVSRKDVALQAIALMQKFDMFKSYLRTEASLSILLELAVEDLQNEIEDEINQSGG